MFEWHITINETITRKREISVVAGYEEEAREKSEDPSNWTFSETDGMETCVNVDIISMKRVEGFLY